LVINWREGFSHILCLSEHHLSTEVIQGVTVDNYYLSAYYCRQRTKWGGACIFIHKSYRSINVDLSSCCKEQDIEICAIKLAHSSLNFCVLSLYRSLSGNFDTFIDKLEEILNLLFVNPINLIICGDFNVNFMTDNTKKDQISSLLKMYNLDYTVNFPT
jgi:exonuclease III